MSVDTYGKIKGYISPEQIAQTIRDKFGVEVTVDVHKHVHEKLDDLDWTFRNYGDSDYWWDEFGYIEFELNGEKRSLFYSYSNINTYENLDYYKNNFPDRPDLKEMVKSEKTHIGLGCWGDSVRIIETIVSAFGGWVDDNDGDSIPYRKIEKGTHDISSEYNNPTHKTDCSTDAPIYRGMPEYDD